MRKADLTIIGGGVIGLSCALHLQEAAPELHITIADAPTRPGIASRAAAGMLAPYAEFQEDSSLFHLCLKSFGYYQDFISRFEIDRAGGPKLDLSGTLIPCNDQYGKRALRLARHAKKHTDVELLEDEDLYREEPLLREGICTKALLVEGGIIDPVKLHDMMKKRVEERGATILEKEVTGFKTHEKNRQKIKSVELSDVTEIESETVLVATGAWSSAIGESLDLFVKIEPVKGQLARYAVGDELLRHVIHCPNIYLAPRPHYGVLFGASMENVGFKGGIEPQKIYEMKQEAEDLIPHFEDRTIMESWFGFRPKFPDGNPAIGWSSKIENMMVATGHFRNGILLVPSTGKIIADQFSNGRPDKKEFYDPVRVGL